MTALTASMLRASSLALDAGVSLATMEDWSGSEDFPAPVATICGEPAWDVFEVRAWRSLTRPSGLGFARFDEVEAGALVSFVGLSDGQTWEKMAQHQARVVNSAEVRNVAGHERVAVLRHPR